ncbi:MAG: polysaccharide biosynthesis/export family protein [bacterium]
MIYRKSSTIESDPGRGAWISLLGALVVLFGLAVLAGCGGPAQLVQEAFVSFTPEQLDLIQRANNQPYRLQRGDIFSLRFHYLKELNQSQALVLPDGSVHLVGIERIQAAGMTISKLDSVLTQAYSRDYLNPDLSVILQEVIGRQVYVLGEVNHPGLYDLPAGGLGIMGAVAVAGGFNKHAKKNSVVLVRTSAAGYLCQKIDLDSFHTLQGAALATLLLQPYDVIYVPRSRIGDMVYFAENVVGTILDFSSLAMNIRALESGQIFYKR